MGVCDDDIIIVIIITNTNNVTRYHQKRILGVFSHSATTAAEL